MKINMEENRFYYIPPRVNPKRFDPEYLKENGPAAAVAVGLALRKAGDR